MKPVLALITDRRRMGAGWPDSLPALVRAAAHAGVQMVQVREHDLDGRALATLVRGCLDAVRGTGTRVLVNDRVDVAVATGAHGVHLRGESLPAAAARAMAKQPFLIGRSVHSVAEAVEAAKGGQLDYLIFGPVFETSSKPGRPAAGLAALGEVVRAVAMPVLAVGGITPDRLTVVARSGAAGAAAIGMFASAAPGQLSSLVGTEGLQV